MSRTALCGALTLGFSPMFLKSTAEAGPQGTQVVAGAADVQVSGTHTEITQHTGTAILTHDSFSIQSNESVNFAQPSASALAVNKVIGQDVPSHIAGQLTANGNVWIINPSGIAVSQSAQVNVNGLIATTADISNADILAGKTTFSGAPTGSSVTNAGSITGGEGSVVLVAPVVDNSGDITAVGGDVALGAGSGFTVDYSGDGLTRFEVTPASGVSVTHTGNISAQGGAVYISAESSDAVQESVVSIGGSIEATRIEDRGGVIVISGGDRGVTEVSGDVIADQAEGDGGEIIVTGELIDIEETANISANGAANGGSIQIGGAYQGAAIASPVVRRASAPADAPLPTAKRVLVREGAQITADAGAEGNGGTAIVWADENMFFYGAVSAKGGFIVGDGGLAEISGKVALAFDGDVDVSATNGSVGGVLFDPANINIVNAMTGTDDAEVADGNVLFNDSPGATFDIGSDAIEGVMGNVTLQATSDITVDDVVEMGANDLVLLASNNINVNDRLTSSGTISLTADADSTGATNGSAQDGVGAIVFGGSGQITGGGTVILSTGAATTLGAITAGSLTVTTSNDNVTQSAAIAVTGTTSISAGSGTVDLSTATNSFGTDIDISAGGITLAGTGAVNLDAITTAGVLDVTSTNNTVNFASAVSVGSIEINGTDIVADQNLTATTGNLALTATNDVSLSADSITASAGNVTITADSDSSTDGDIVVSTSNNTVTATTGTVALSVSGGANSRITDTGVVFLQVNAGSGEFLIDDITFDSSNSHFAVNARDVSIAAGTTVNSSILTLGNSQADQTDIGVAAVVAGTDTFELIGTEVAQITTSSFQVVSQTSSATMTISNLSLGTTDVTLTNGGGNNGPLVFDGNNVFNNLQVNVVGAISQTGSLTVNGTTTITPVAQFNGGGIVLDNTGNDFVGAVTISTSGQPITLVDTNDIVLGAITADSLSVSASDISLAGALNVNSISATNSQNDEIIIAASDDGIASTFDLTVGEFTTLLGTANNLTLTASDIDINDTLNIGTNTLTAINTSNDAVTIGGGGDMNGSTFELSQTDLDNLTAGAIVVSSGPTETTNATVTVQGATFGSAVSIDANDGQVLFTDSNADTTGTGSTFANLTVTESASINQTAQGGITITGTGDGVFTTDGSGTLTGQNDFTTSSFSFTGDNLELNEVSDIALAAISLTGTLSLTANGTITDTAGNRIEVAGNSTLRATDGAAVFHDIILDNSVTGMATDIASFGNTVTATGEDIRLQNTGDLTLGAITTNNDGVEDTGSESIAGTGSLSIAAGGSIIDEGVITAAGTGTAPDAVFVTSAAAGMGAIVIDGVDSSMTPVTLAHSFAGEIRLDTDPGDAGTHSDITFVAGSTGANLTLNEVNGQNVTITAIGGDGIVDSTTATQQIAGTATYNAIGAIILDNTANVFDGAVNVDADFDNNLVAAAIEIAGTGNITLGAIDATTLDVTTTGTLTQAAGGITATGTTSLTATNDIDLDGTNTLSGTINVSGEDIRLRTSGMLALGAVTASAGADTTLDPMTGGDLSVTGTSVAFNGALTDVNDLTASATDGTITQTAAISYSGAGTFSAVNTTGGAGTADITLFLAANDFGTLVNATGDDVRLQDSGDITLGGIGAATLEVSVSGGIVDDAVGGSAADDVVVTGNTTLTGSGVVQLDTAFHDFADSGSGASITATGSSITLFDSDSLILGTINQTAAGGALFVRANGAMTQAGVITSVGTGGATFANDGGVGSTITLTNTSNTITGQAAFDTDVGNSGDAADVEFVGNTNTALNLGGVRGRNVTITSDGTGDIIATAGGTQQIISGNAFYRTDGGAITLTNSLNAFTGIVNADSDFDDSGDHNAVSITASGGIQLGAIEATTLTITAGGAITDEGIIDASGNAAFLTESAGAAPITIDAQNTGAAALAHVFGGTITLDTDTSDDGGESNITFTDPDTSGTLDLALVDGATVTITGSGTASIVDSGDQQITGNAFYRTNSGAITLINGNNTFSGEVHADANFDGTVPSDAGNVSIIGVGDVTLGAIDAGTLGVTAGETLTQNVATVISAQSTSNFTATTGDIDLNGTNSLVGSVNLAGEDIRLNNGGNALSLGTVTTANDNSDGTLGADGDLTVTGTSVAIDGALSVNDLVVTATTAGISQTASVVATGQVDLDAATTIVLQDNGNDFGTVVNAGGTGAGNATSISLRDSGAITLGDIDTGDLLIETLASGNIFDDGVTAGTGSDVNATGSATLLANGAGAIVIDDANTDFVDTGASASVSATGATVNLFDTDGIVLGDISQNSPSGVLIVYADGAITDVGTINSDGTFGSDFATEAGTSGTITLDSTSSTFDGFVRLNTDRGSDGGLADITFIDNDAAGFDLAALQGNNVTVTAEGGGDINVSNPALVSGNVFFRTDGGSITATSATNDFQGQVHADTNFDDTGSDENLVSIIDGTGGLQLGAIAASSLVATSTGGDIIDTSGSQISVTGATSLTATTSNIVLDNTTGEHDFDSDISGDTLQFSAVDVTIRDVDRLSIGTSAATGSATLTAMDFDIDGTLTVGGGSGTVTFLSSRFLLSSTNSVFALSGGNGFFIQFNNDDAGNVASGTAIFREDATVATTDFAGVINAAVPLAVYEFNSGATIGNIQLETNQTGADIAFGLDTAAAGTTSQFQGSLTALSADDIIQRNAHAISVSGTTSLSGDVVTLDASGNEFVDSVTASVSALTLTDQNSIVLADIDVTTGGMTVTALGGTITQDASVLGDISGDHIDVVGATSLSATGGITLDNVFNDFDEGSTVAVSVSAGSDITLRDEDAIALGNINASGAGSDLTLTSGGNVTQGTSTAVSVAGISTINAAGFDVTLANVDGGGVGTNDLATLTGSANSFNIAEVSAITLSGVTATAGDVDVAAAGNISVTGGTTVQATGDVSLSGADITVDTSGIILADNDTSGAGDAILIGTGAVTGNASSQISGDNVTLSGTSVNFLGDSITANTAGATPLVGAVSITASTGSINLDGVTTAQTSITGSAATDINVQTLNAAALSLTTTNGDIIQDGGVITVPGASTLTAGGTGQNIDMDLSTLNNFGSISVSAADDTASFSDADAVELAGVTAGTFNLNAGGAVTDTADLVIGTGNITTSGDLVTLDDPDNDFTVAINVDTSNAGGSTPVNVVIEDTNALPLGTIIADALTATADGSITQASGAITVSALNVTSEDAGEFSDIQLTATANSITGEITAAGEDIAITNAAAAAAAGQPGTTLGVITTNGGGTADTTNDGLGQDSDGDFLLTSTGGGIGQAAGDSLVIAGSTSLVAQNGGTFYDVLVANTGNNFSDADPFGAIGEDITVVDSNGIQLGAITTNATATDTLIPANTGAFSLTAGGAITDEGVISIAGDTSVLTTGGAASAINIDGIDSTPTANALAHAFTGTVALSASGGAADISLVDADGAGLTLGNVTGNNATIYASGIADIVATSGIQNIAGNAFYRTDLGAITLDNTGNDFAMQLHADGNFDGTVASDAGNVIIYDNAGGLILGDIDAAALTITSVGGAVTDVGGAAVGGGINTTGSTTITATGFDVTLDDTVHDFGGADNPNDETADIDITANNITLYDTDGIQLGAITTGAMGNLSVTAEGSITDNAAKTILVNGTTTLTAVDGTDFFDIQLDNTSHDFVNAVSLTGEDIEIADANSITVTAQAIGGTSADATIPGNAGDFTVNAAEITINDLDATGTSTVVSAGALSLTDISVTGSFNATATDDISIGQITSTAGGITLRTTTGNFIINPFGTSATPLSAAQSISLTADIGSFAGNTLQPGATFQSSSGGITFDFASAFTVVTPPGGVDNALVFIAPGGTVLDLKTGDFAVGPQDFLDLALAPGFDPTASNPSALNNNVLMRVFGPLQIRSTGDLLVRLPNTEIAPIGNSGTGLEVTGVTTFFGPGFEAISVFGTFAGLPDALAASGGFVLAGGLTADNANLANGCVIGAVSSCTPLGSQIPILEFDDGRLLNIKFVDPSEDEDDPFSNRGDEEEWE